MATAFDTALTSAQTEAVGYVNSALPVIAAVGVAWLGIKFLKRIFNKV